MTDEGGMYSGAGRNAAWKRLLTTAIEAWRARASARRARVRPGREPRLPRSRAGAAFEARLAVRSGVRLEDFLRHRLATYATRLPVPLEDLPVRIDVENGEPVVLARPPRASLVTSAAGASRTAADRWLRALEEREGPAAVREVRELETALVGLEWRGADAQARVDAVAKGIADDLAAGILTSAPEIEATAEQLGRPAVPSPLPVHVLRGFALALLAAEAWRLADPILAATGLSTATLADAAQHAPVSAALGLVFALGAAAAVFTFLAAAVSRLHAVADDPGTPRRRALLAVVALGASALAAAVASTGAAPGQLADPVLLVAVPLAAVLMVRHAARLEAAREVCVVAALEWDRARAAQVVVRAQRAEALARAEAELAGIGAERDAVRRRLRTLEARALEAARASEETSALQARRLERLAESLAGALELDRYAFLRLSANAPDLLARPVRPESRTRLEPAVAPERLGVA